MALRAICRRSPLVGTRLGLIELRNLWVLLHLFFPVVFQQETRRKSGIVVVVVTASSLAGIELEILVGFQVLEGHLVTVGAKIVGNGDSHFAGDPLVVFTMAGDTVGGFDLAGEDDVLGILEFSDRVGV